jgi:hypothetical protein
MPQAVSRHLVIAEDYSRCQANPCETGGGKSGIGTGFSSSILVFLLSVSFHQFSIPVFIYMPFLPEGQTVKVWKPSKE